MRCDAATRQRGTGCCVHANLLVEEKSAKREDDVILARVLLTYGLTVAARAAVAVAPEQTTSAGACSTCARVVAGKTAATSWRARATPDAARPCPAFKD